MSRKSRQYGFSLTETLMAVGTLAIGLTFIAGTFLTGIYFSTFSTERSIAAVAAEEAFAKMQIFSRDPDGADIEADEHIDYNDIAKLAAREWRYPSVAGDIGKQYSWAAICRRIVPDSNLVQCTVFVSREAGGKLSYWKRDGNAADAPLEVSDRPRPVRIQVDRDSSADENEIRIQDDASSANVDERTFVSEGSILVDDATGNLYRVLERVADRPGAVKLDRDWEGGDLTDGSGGRVWVVPPAASGGRNPGVAVYQKVLTFPGR